MRKTMGGIVSGITKGVFVCGLLISLFIPIPADANILVTNGDTNLVGAGGSFYRVETPTALSTPFNATGVPLTTSTQNIAAAFTNAGDFGGVIFALYSSVAINDRSVTVVMKESGTIRATMTLTASQITNGMTNFLNTTFIVPFVASSPYYTIVTPSAITFDIYTTGGTVGTWNIKTSGGALASAYLLGWCRTTVAFSDGNDAIVAKDVLTINGTATVKGVVGGAAAYAPAITICKSEYATPLAPKLVWENSSTGPTGSYTLSVNGVILFGAHSGMQIGSATYPIPAATKAVLSFVSPTVGTTCGLLEVDVATATTAATRDMNLWMYGATPATRWTTLSSNANAGQKIVNTTVATGWTPGGVGVGDYVWIGGNDATGVGTIKEHYVASISGTQITLDSNMDAAMRRAGHPIFNLEGTGIRFEGLGATAVLRPYVTLKFPSNLTLQGVEMRNINAFVLANTTTPPCLLRQFG